MGVKEFSKTLLLLQRLKLCQYSKSYSTKRFPIISCKRKQLDFYHDTTYKKNEEIPLASKGWNHKDSRGDYFIIHRNAMNNIADEHEFPHMKSFLELGLNENIVKSIGAITIPTNIQARAIPVVLSGRNTLITAETGCGKTLAYLLPLLQQLMEWKKYRPERPLNTPLALIILPSRELTNQIAGVAEEICRSLSLDVKCVVGGRTKQKMLNPEFDKIDVLISSLGALSKLVTTGVYKISNVHHVVLDEADTLLDDSFNEKLTYFLRNIRFQFQMTFPPTGSQLTLASATMPNELPNALQNFIDVTSLVKITSNNLHKMLPNVPQRFLRLGPAQKAIELLKLIRADVNRGDPVMIFSNQSTTCDWVSMFLNENGIKCVNMNGKTPVTIKAGMYDKFVSGEVNVLSCTDIASRGLDTVKVKHVINYDFPLYSADYIHRCGRTGRIGSPLGCRVTNFVSSESQIQLVKKIELSVRNMVDLPNVNGNITNLIKQKIEKQIRQERNKMDKFNNESEMKFGERN